MLQSISSNVCNVKRDLITISVVGKHGIWLINWRWGRWSWESCRDFSTLCECTLCHRRWRHVWVLPRRSCWLEEAWWGCADQSTRSERRRTDRRPRGCWEQSSLPARVSSSTVLLNITIQIQWAYYKFVVSCQCQQDVNIKKIKYCKLNTRHVTNKNNVIDRYDTIR